jgi:hypothetical protein
VADLYLALMHHPVVDRNRRIVTSAITSLDIHDLARSCCTFGVRAFFIVHPVAEQRKFAGTVIDHWKFDFGRAFDGRRREALELVHIVGELDEAVRTAEQASGARPLLVHTSARTEKGIAFAELRKRLDESSQPLLILLGTGFGLAAEVADRADVMLEPIRGAGDYNHLSVRAAGAIILDRLRGS